MLISFLIALISNIVLACPISDADMDKYINKIAYDNSLPLSFKPGILGSASEAEFHEMIDRAKVFYTPIFNRYGYNFRIERSWLDDELNAFASQRGNRKSVAMFGGYARVMSKDAFLTVLCHEIGHHLGGFPIKKSSDWASAEGQSDYFSTLRCMKDLLKGDIRNRSISLKLELPESVKRACQHQYGVRTDSYYICLRGAKAAEDYGQMIATRRGMNPATISLLSPSLQTVASTIEKHPEAQCRVDTKLQGILCNVPTNMGISSTNELIGTCNFATGQKLGIRPACWFKAGI